ncbi:DsrE family protein [Fulvivirga sedimenti]|uniref:DsrE family protein n=1 Tax=Fulvivirga sedimenti TaxID=2879465 RepID=A0A9X1HV66_9BACT|nr:DsrE family protein [Fulvivirga sedimenti]MCA6078879.1 DsrE family protein [Fulvivirga sedimenti]
MKKFLFLVAVILLSSNLYSQLPPYLEGKLIYPVLNFHPFMGVIKTENTSLTYNEDIEYKVVIDVYDRIKDSTQINDALREAARTYNLNVANGVPAEKLKMAVVVHGGACQAILDDATYQDKYGVPNPNIPLIARMSEDGVKFYVCAQSIGILQIPRESLAPQIEVSLSAKTALITLDQMGYSYLNVNED